jgi:hypothetical protein
VLTLSGLAVCISLYVAPAYYENELSTKKKFNSKIIHMHESYEAGV